MTDTKATKYIYHSEKTKTTCDECKKHDREVYYDIKDIPKLPIHPNCKCWIETMELPANKNTKCDCIDRFKVLTDNLNNLINNTNIIKESYKDELTECLNELSNINSEYVRENISETDKNKFQEKIYNIEDKIYYFEKDLNNFIKKEENLLTDIEMTKEFSFDNTYHTKEQCLSNKDLINHSKNLSILCSTIDDFSDRLKQIKEDRKDISREIKETIKEEKKKEKETKQLKEGKITGGASPVSFVKQKAAEVGMGTLYASLGYPYAKHEYGPDTVGMIDIAHKEENMHNQDYIRDTIKLKNWNDPKVASDRKYLVKKVGEQFMDFGFNVNEISGYFFKNNSEPSKRIAQDSDFLNKIKENRENILNGKDISMEFPRYKDNKKSNLHYAFAHVDIRNGYLDKEGNLHIKVYDTYDFNKENKTPLNQAGREAMLRGELKPFFTIHDILIPKDVMSKLWK